MIGFFFKFLLVWQGRAPCLSSRGGSKSTFPWVVPGVAVSIREVPEQLLTRTGHLVVALASLKRQMFLKIKFSIGYQTTGQQFNWLLFCVSPEEKT
jgi:hypothetical protein